MNNSSNDYHISFFKPTTPQAKANRNMVIWLVLVWCVAIFGFHFLLRIIEKPTPEPTYVTFESVWPKIENGTASDTDVQEFGKASLSVLCKIAIAADDKPALNNALSWSVYKLTADSLRGELVAKVKAMEEKVAAVTDLKDTQYTEAKKSFSAAVCPLLNLSTQDIRAKILPNELVSANIDGLLEESKKDLPSIMAKYLIHNQSFLTDTKFLGFPFHYFYSAVFLLILFVGLCWVYCVNTDKINAKFDIAD